MLKLTKLKASPLILPPSRPKDEDTMPYKDWLRACGIDGIQTEDDVIRERDKRFMKALRFGKRTPNNELTKAFPTIQILRQLDVKQADGRSSDIGLVLLYYENRCLVSHSGIIVISEHAVRRYWAHTGQRPNIEEWLSRYPKWLDADTNVTELYSEDGLLLGERFLSVNMQVVWHIDHKIEYKNSGLGFRIKTAIPVNQLNENQTARWYKLKQQWENNA